MNSSTAGSSGAGATAAPFRGFGAHSSASSAGAGAGAAAPGAGAASKSWCVRLVAFLQIVSTAPQRTSEYSPATSARTARISALAARIVARALASSPSGRMLLPPRPLSYEYLRRPTTLEHSLARGPPAATRPRTIRAAPAATRPRTIRTPLTIRGPRRLGAAKTVFHDFCGGGTRAASS